MGLSTPHTIYYLSVPNLDINTKTPGATEELAGHHYTSTNDYGIIIFVQYAGDIFWVAGPRKHGMEEQKIIIPSMLVMNLSTNHAKNEERAINQENNVWQNCRYLDLLLSTEKDIKRRERLENIAVHNQGGSSEVKS